MKNNFEENPTIELNDQEVYVKKLLESNSINLFERDLFKDRLYDQIIVTMDLPKKSSIFNNIFLKARIGFIGIVSFLVITIGLVILPNLSNLNNINQLDTSQNPAEDQEFTAKTNELDKSLEGVDNQIKILSDSENGNSLTESDIAF